MRSSSLIKKSICTICCALLLIAVTASPAFAFESVRFAISELCGHIQGNFGGLLMITAGLGGLVSAAFGNFRAMQGMLIVGIGCVSVSTIMSFYFGEAAQICATGEYEAGDTDAATRENLQYYHQGTFDGEIDYDSEVEELF